MSIPAFGLGTYRLKGLTVMNSVRTALELGYRAIDTAQIYDNEVEVGQAIAESGVPHDELFVTTKIWTDKFPRSLLLPSLKDSLTRLRLDHVDLALIHWPSPGGKVPVAEYMGALAQAKAQGLARQIGVSNFTIPLLREAIAAVGADQIATNQIELHPYLQNRRVAEFCRQNGIHVTSYMTLAYGEVLDDPVLGAIGQAHGVGAAQVALAWAMQLGYSVIPSSTRRENLAANLKAVGLRLSEDEMAQIAALDQGRRLCDFPGLSPQWDD